MTREFGLEQLMERKMNMNLNIKSEIIGVFTYNHYANYYEHNDGKIHWTLKSTNEKDNVNSIVKKAEEIFEGLDEFDKKAKEAIAEEFIDNEDDFCPEYDENNENLDLVVEENNVTRDKIINLITLHDVEIRENGICCKYYGGAFFEGLIITAYFNNEYQLLSAEG